jgi:capsular exopolysaccharide synthesis family protein
LYDETRSNSAKWLEPPQEELGLKRYVETIRERLWFVLLAILICTAASVAYVLTAPKTYKAEAQMLVTPVPSDTFPGLPLIRESSDPTRDVSTASQLVTNTDVANRVKDRLTLSDSPEDLLKKVAAEPVAQSNIVSVTATEKSPEKARDLANAFAEEAVADRTTTLHAAIQAQITSLQGTLQAGPNPSVSGRIAELQGVAGGPDPTFTVETPATAPENQASPRPVLTVAGGMLAGLVLGIAGAFASQILDPRLRREEQLRRRYRLPILARIPRETGWRKNEPLGPRRVSAATAEAYRTLRGTLEAQSQAQHPTQSGSRVILVTGAAPSEGKTTSALNLASSLALAGRRVILIEADLRRPSLAQALNVQDPHYGVVSVLIENVQLHDALLSTPTYGQNLQILLADYSGGWIAELFSIPAAQKLIDDARQYAEYVVVDSPPLTEVVDALPLARKADDVLIVTKLGKTRLDKIQQLAELLAENGITPSGFAVVGVPRPSRGEYSYYREEAPLMDGSRGDVGSFERT